MPRYPLEIPIFRLRLHFDDCPHLVKRRDLLYQELDRLGICMRPSFYLSDEWYCPTESTCIAVPFYLACPGLTSKERSLGGWVEGDRNAHFMRLARHETGHCFDHAWNLSRSLSFKSCFGDPRKPYQPDRYRYMIRHPDFVQNLPKGYAQSHPYEDFAETFAWVLAQPNQPFPGSCSPVLRRKIEFVLESVERYGRKIPRRTLGEVRPLMASRLRRTLRQHYATKREDSKLESIQAQ